MVGFVLVSICVLMLWVVLIYVFWVCDFLKRWVLLMVILVVVVSVCISILLLLLNGWLFVFLVK